MLRGTRVKRAGVNLADGTPTLFLVALVNGVDAAHQVELVCAQSLPISSPATPRPCGGHRTRGEDVGRGGE